MQKHTGAMSSSHKVHAARSDEKSQTAFSDKAKLNATAELSNPILLQQKNMTSTDKNQLKQPELEWQLLLAYYSLAKYPLLLLLQ